jgi:Ser/Thr protein kinase RdoA (MazF antagonist)
MSLLQSAPSLTAADAARLAHENYGVSGTAQPLPSERDQNFLIESGSSRFVLKAANRTEQRAILEAQNAALSHLESRVPFCPRVVQSLDGQRICEAPSGHFVRLVTWLPGIPLGTLPQHPPDLLADLGRCIGLMDKALADFDHPALHRRFHWDLAGAIEIVVAKLPEVVDVDLRHIIQDDVERIAERGTPLLPRLRRSIVHNDGNDYNVLVDAPSTGAPRITGLIDFGDMVHSFTVGDVAVASAYAVLDKPDPLAALVLIVREYHAQYPLTPDEVGVVFDFLKLRLYLSIAHAIVQQRQRPDDDYLTISQGAIRRTLPRLWTIDAQAAEARLHEACDSRTGMNSEDQG